jgi:molybdenum cofactor cytidylyltransferase
MSGALPRVRFAAIVLAAGESERMGKPKALLDFDGRTALSLAIDACRGGGAHRIVVVLGARAKEVSDSLEKRDLFHRRSKGVAVQTVVHAGFRAGQTSSVKSGVEAIDDPGCGLLVLPVDHPLVTGEDVAAVGEAYRRSHERGQRIFVATHNKRRGHPVLFGERLARAILALGDGDPLHRVVRAEAGRVVEVPVRNEHVLTDADTTEEYEALLAAFRARHTPA